MTRSTQKVWNRVILLAAFLTVVAVQVPAAEAILFDFDSLADNSSNGTVQTYMRNILQGVNAAWSVDLSGSKGEKNYTGDNRVVGPVNGATVTSETLGTSNFGVHHNGANDTFLQNTGSTTIAMQFNFPIYSVSFDYEIFPDATTPDWRNSSTANPNWPDFTFKADGTVQFHTFGIAPGASGTFLHSPNSGAVNNEFAPQFLGQSGTWFFSGGVTKLEFVDWPVAIGIDNLCVNAVPEPSALFLFGSGLIGMLGLRVTNRRSR